MVRDSQIEPIVLLSKSDLLSTREIEDRVAEIHKIMPHLRVQPFSNENETGLKNVKALLAPRKTYCLLGSSGVGKTTIIKQSFRRSTIYHQKSQRER